MLCDISFWILYFILYICQVVVGCESCGFFCLSIMNLVVIIAKLAKEEKSVFFNHVTVIYVFQPHLGLYVLVNLRFYCFFFSISTFH